MPWISGNRYLSQGEMENNARLVRSALADGGFSINAICAILGNMQSESSINPGIWQNLKPGSAGGGGYGLVQWTPWTKYSEWAGSGWENNGDKECERIIYEFAHGIQYYSTSQYPLSAAQFRSSDKAPGYLANAFIYNYERPSNKNQPKRAKQAEAWYRFLTGEEPPKPNDPGQPDNPDTPPDPDYPPDVKMGLEPWILARFGSSFNKYGLLSTR